MRRTPLFLTPDQITALKAIAARTGESVSAVARRAFDEVISESGEIPLFQDAPAGCIARIDHGDAETIARPNRRRDIIGQRVGRIRGLLHLHIRRQARRSHL